ncbi:exosortase/archaeosortase family protein [Desulforhopalus sp. IMCC35007]|uniref:exosortase/archaeosortase family protein n=1 Tax=Desulforhopalus sp. IMCC35007 TaxID=2569543 RepID=UPI0010AE39FE|nr:exosortase/archaeosortase family protein [Desulforhopalus sp. IMCC35007]TKB07429.1 exosortase [Desulforhopalus sp. IMCC35007]
MRTDDSRWESDMLIPLLLVGVALLGLYIPFLQSLFADWDTNENYSHGYFVPFIFAYMIYSVKDKLLETKMYPVNIGFILVALGLAILIVGKIGAEFFLQRFSLIIVLLGIVLFLMGREYLKILSIPILYLIFMVPLPAIIWNKIAFPLQLFGSFLTEQIIRFLGIPVFREGNILHLSETTLEVVAACSGLRSLVTMFALSSLLVWMSSLSSARKWFLFFAAAPAAICANIIRLTVTAILASKYGSEVAEGFLHDFSGVFTFVIGLLMLLLVNKIIERKSAA